MANLWELELQEIEATMSRTAREDLYCNLLAGLGGAEPERLEDLALKAQALVAEERAEDLREYVADRIDVIVYEQRAQAQEKRGKLPGEEEAE